MAYRFIFNYFLEITYLIHLTLNGDIVVRQLCLGLQQALGDDGPHVGHRDVLVAGSCWCWSSWA